MTWSFICIAVSALVCLLGPTVLAVVWIKKHGAKLRAFLLGVVVFTVFQILTRIPLLGWMQDTAWFVLFAKVQPVLLIVLIALSAGVFEEVGRYVGIRLLLKPDMMNWDNAFVFGLGHGGIEAFWLVGINYAVLLVQMLGGQVPAVVMGTPALQLLAGGAERVLAVILHIGFSMLVFYAVRNRKPLYLLIAIAVHAVVDAIIPLLARMGIALSVWASEGVLAVMAVLMVILIVQFKPLLGREGFNKKGETL